MSRAVVVHELGGPEVLKLEERPALSPKAGQVVVRNEAIGLNFVDVYQRTGLYKLPAPFTPGGEGAGTITAVGDGVTDLKIGDRVLYNSGGAYAGEVAAPQDKIVRLPDDISSEAAATLVTKGGTAHYLLFETWPLKAADTILVHAASGGVGSLLVQWATAQGATVIALAGSDEKVATARANGAKHAFNSREDGWVAKVREATGGRGVDVVYDSVGRDTYPASLDCLKPRGLWASFGNSSGPVDAFNIGILAQKGALYATRPTLFTYVATRPALEACANSLFDVVQSNKVRININQTYPLAEAGRAHTDLETRKTSGTTLLIP